jgi:hypothetical protein
MAALFPADRFIALFTQATIHEVAEHGIRLVGAEQIMY